MKDKDDLYFILKLVLKVLDYKFKVRIILLFKIFFVEKSYGFILSYKVYLF